MKAYHYQLCSYMPIYGRMIHTSVIMAPYSVEGSVGMNNKRVEVSP